jgi:glycosyltransferase involved in cell wall biosynthesis
MKQILCLSKESWPAEKERVENLVSRMAGYDFLFINPPGYKGPVKTTLPNLRCLSPGAGMFREKRFKKMVSKAAAAADVILISPAGEAGHLEVFGKPVRPLPEGADFELFFGAAERSLPFPDDLFTVKNPIIGHIGPLEQSDNLKIIKTAAEAKPEWAFVFVGPVCADVGAWGEIPNIHMLGEKPRSHLPAYISRFDVCINIAKRADASPVKLFEYLAAGKPIVSTPHPAQVLDYTETVYLAGTPEEFISCCGKAIGERDAWKVRRRVEYGRAAGWDARAAELERTLKEIEGNGTAK